MVVEAAEGACVRGRGWVRGWVRARVDLQLVLAIPLRLAIPQIDSVTMEGRQNKADAGGRALMGVIVR